MDEELHEHVDQVSGSKEVPKNSYETAPLTDYEVDESSSSMPADDDSFGEATADCIPDKKFLEAILEDYHPNRVHLLNPTPQGSGEKQDEPNTPNEPRKRNDDSERSATDNGLVSSPGNDIFPAIKSSENVETSSRKAKKEELEAQPKISGEEEGECTQDREEGGADNEEEGTEGDDSFPAVGEVPPPSRPGLNKNMLGDMGKSTKKSFRRINGTFWAKPFKNLGRSMRTNGKNEDS